MSKKYIYMEGIRDRISDPVIFDNYFDAKQMMINQLASKLNPENKVKIEYAGKTGAISSTSVLADMGSTYFDRDSAFCIIENTEDPNFYNHWFAKISEVEI